MSTCELLVPCVLLACAACRPLPPITPTEAASRADAAAGAQASCDLVCEQAHVGARVEDAPDDVARATASANQVLAAMHPDLHACYRTRVAATAEADGALTVDVLIGADGHVEHVETSGGAVLGPTTVSCLTGRIERAVFEPPRGGGTLTIHVPFSLRRVSS